MRRMRHVEADARGLAPIAQHVEVGQGPKATCLVAAVQDPAKRVVEVPVPDRLAIVHLSVT